MPIRALAFFVIVFSSWSLASSAMAEGEKKPDFVAAKRHFKAGQEFLQMDRYADAVVEFKKAYEITKDGLVMGQVAEGFAKAGDYESALAALGIYREALPESERAPADELKREYEKAIQAGRSHKLVLPEDTQDQAGESKKAEGTPLTAYHKEPERKKGRLYTWIALGSAGALALSALVVGLSAQSKFDELSSPSPEGCKPSCSDSQVDSVKTRALVTDILWGTAIAAGITGGVLYLLEGRGTGASSHERPEPASEGGEEEVRLRLRIQPVAGAGRYGVNAGFQF